MYIDLYYFLQIWHVKKMMVLSSFDVGNVLLSRAQKYKGKEVKTCSRNFVFYAMRYTYYRSVGRSRFYLWCLRPDHNEILHEGGPLDPNVRKNTWIQLP